MSQNYYPEHLNPFSEESTKKKSTLKISNSFRELKNTLRKSFRIKPKKTKDAVEIRKHEDYVRPTTISYPDTSPTTPALPRSRFRDRLSANPQETTYNPFDNVDGQNNEIQTRSRKKKWHKKKAPLPPNSLSSQHSGINYASHSSQWSITSTDSNYTCDPQTSEKSSIVEGMDLQTLTKEFAEFNKNMETFNDDNNNKDLVTPSSGDIKETKSSRETPDIVHCCEGTAELNEKSPEGCDNETKKEINLRIGETVESNRVSDLDLAESGDIIQEKPDLEGEIPNPKQCWGSSELKENLREGNDQESSNDLGARNNVNSDEATKGSLTDLVVTPNGDMVETKLNVPTPERKHSLEESIEHNTELEKENKNDKVIDSINNNVDESIEGNKESSENLYNKNNESLEGLKDEPDKDCYLNRVSLYIDGSKEDLETCGYSIIK